MMADDWLPMNMVVSQDAAEINAFVADRQLVDIADYLRGNSD